MRLLILLILVSESIKDFTLAMIIGVIIGTFTSIFIASPLLVVWDKLSRRAKD